MEPFVIIGKSGNMTVVRIVQAWNPHDALRRFVDAGESTKNPNGSYTPVVPIGVSTGAPDRAVHAIHKVAFEYKIASSGWVDLA